MSTRLLVVTAVPAESQALLTGHDDLCVYPVGVGPAAAAAATATLIARAAYAGAPFHVVVCAGIGGGFPGRAEPGDTVVGTDCVAADLGADSPDGFLPLEELGFGTHRAPVDNDLRAALTASLAACRSGGVLTVSTVTGTSARAETLARRYPTAAAEAMEGFGVATAAAGAGLPFVEVRTISNLIGPRDRDAWRIPEALRALSVAAPALAALTSLVSLADVVDRP